MLLIQTIVLIAVLALFFINFRLGLALYISYFLLVPFPSVAFGGVFFSSLTINVILIIAYLYKFKNGFDFSIIKPMLVLYLLLFCESLFQYRLNFYVQYRFFYEDLLQFFVLPIVICSASKKDYTILRFCMSSIFISFLIIIIYNFFLFLVSDVNPYVLLMASEHNVNLQVGQFEFESRTGLTQRLSSVFPHPMSFGVYLGLSMIYFMNKINEKPQNIFFIVLIVISIFISGVRTTMAAFFIVGLFYLLLKHKIKYFFAAITFVVGLYIISLYCFPSLIEILMSFTASGTDTGGSTMEMRIEQFNGCLEEISDNPLWGNGYSWHKYYVGEYKSHPVIRCFESLLFIVICNWGWVGFFFFIICFIWMFCQIKINVNEENGRYVLYCLWVFYLSYSLITGDYGYMQYAMLFYSIIYCSLMYKDTNSKKVQITCI